MSMMYIEVKIVCNRFVNSKESTQMKIINFKKKKNKGINKRAAGIIWKCKNLLHL